jgi:glycosyltransferase involved in cell wall biosynthesis
MKVAFLAMSNHIYITHSSDFFIDLLRGLYGEVDVIPHEKAWVELPKCHWDLIVVWQKLYSPKELEAFGADRVIIVPMLDACPFDEAYWRDFKAFKVFCFSTTLRDALISYGLEAWGVQYYPEDQEDAIDWGSGLRGFFWPRTPAVDWPLVKRLTAGSNFERMHLHGTSVSSQGEPGVETSEWFADQSEYRRCLAGANVYFAPRLAEGIGLSFLEAMAMGLCVVAPDRPTMNEYIENGKNGLLYDPQKPEALDFSRARELGKAARSSCENGRQAWIDARADIRRFLEEPARGGYAPKAHRIIEARGKLIARLRYVPGLFAFYRFLRASQRAHTRR